MNKASDFSKGTEIQVQYILVYIGVPTKAITLWWGWVYFPKVTDEKTPLHPPPAQNPNTYKK
jgi:hypothetical protein